MGRALVAGLILVLSGIVHGQTIVRIESGESLPAFLTVTTASKEKIHEVILMWDASPSEQVEGYYIYVRSPGLPTRKEDVSNVTEAHLGIDAPGSYTFTVSAYVLGTVGQPSTLRRPSKPVVKP